MSKGTRATDEWKKRGKRRRTRGIARRRTEREVEGRE